MQTEHNPFQSPQVNFATTDNFLEGNEDLLVASTGQRFTNMILDMIFFNIFNFVIFFILAAVGLNTVLPEDGTPSMDTAVKIYLISFAIFLLYYVPLEAGFGQTFGKMLTKTKVVANDGSPCTFKKALGRTFARLIPFEAFSFLSGDGRPIGWHDRLSGTQVISIQSTNKEKI